MTVVLIGGLSLAHVGPAAAFSAPPTKPIEELLDSNDPYQAFDIVAGYNLERTRRVGFANCLPEVLVRVSGEPRLERDPRVAGLAAHADALVASYDYSDFLVRMGPVHDDQGTGDERPYDLVVRFDHGKIDGVLRDLGVPPWPGTSSTPCGATRPGAAGPIRRCGSPVSTPTRKLACTTTSTVTTTRRWGRT